MKSPLDKLLREYNKRNKLSVTLSAAGILIFLLVAITFPFRDNIFSLLFGKKISLAAGPNDWAQVQKDSQRTGYSSEQINPPYTLKWKWNFDQTNPVRLSHKAQPIVAFGKMFIGGFDGKMYAVNTSTTGGTVAPTLWSFQSGGPITNSAAAENSKVVFGSDEGKVYALNEADGAKVWEYQAEAGFDSAPLIVSNTVYIGSKDGNFYALDLNNGSLIWKYTVGEPIYQTAAFSQSANAIIFAAEDMFVYALNTNGTLKWKSPKLRGRSFKNYWPVISDSKGVAVLRSAPSFPFHEMIQNGDSIIQGANGGSCPTDTPDDPAKRTSEQTAIKTYFTNDPDRKTFFALNLSDGTEKFVAPVLYTGGAGTTADVPVIGTDGNALVIWRSCYSQFDGGGFVTSYKDLGKLDLTTGTITPYSKLDTGMNFRLISDEESVLTLGGTKLFVTMSESIGNHDITTGTGSFLLKEKDNPAQYNGNQSLFGAVQPKYSTDDAYGHLAPEWAPAVITNGMIIWKMDGSTIAAFSGQ